MKARALILLSTSLLAVATATATATDRFAGFTSRLGTVTPADRAEFWQWSPANRADAQDAYFNVYLANDQVPFSSTANPATYTPGVTAPAFRAAELLALNYHRYYFFGDAVTYATEGRELAQFYFSDLDTPAYINTTVQDCLEAAALVMAVNGRLSHTPDASWLGYSPLAAAGAGSLMSLETLPAGSHPRPASAVEGLLTDSGPNNFAGMGHRGGLLASNPLVNFASVLAGNKYAVATFDNTLLGHDLGAAPAGTEAVLATWPAKGTFVPYQWFWAVRAEEGVRMSAALAQNPDVSGAVVTVKRNGTPMPVSNTRLTSAGLTWDVAVPDLQTAPAADHVYSVTIANVYGGKTLSYSFTVFDPAKILPAPIASKGAIFNLATRAVVGAGDNVLIAGFVITGNEPLRIAIRAQGPSLRALGIAHSATNPTVSIVRRESDGWHNLGSIDNWRDGSSWRMVQSLSLAPTDDHDAVAIATLTPGVYCAVVSEVNDANAGGVGIVEVFNIDAASSSSLANVSTRGWCGSGEDQLIGGLILHERTTVVVRTQGPGLVPLGVSNAVAGTRLQVFKISRDGNSELVNNTSWRTAPGSDRLATDLAYYAPSSDREAAAVLTLDPGSYTFNVTPSDGRAGVAIIEIFKP